MNEIYHQALKILQRRDHTVQQLRRKLERKFGTAPETVLTDLLKHRYLDDRRFAENLVAKHHETHPSRLRARLEDAGVAADIIEDVLVAAVCPSIRAAVKAKMADWHLRPPLELRQAARLFRALSRLGYSEDEIREELEQLNEQQ